MRKITLLLLFLSCISQFGQSKKVFDVELKDHLQEGLYKHGPEREGKTLEGENLEYSILNGGYFTFGTSSSYSENSLDQNFVRTIQYQACPNNFSVLLTMTERLNERRRRLFLTARTYRTPPHHFR